MIDNLSIYFGKDIKITNNITLHVPTIKEIIEVGESQYLHCVSTFTMTHLDEAAIVFLDSIGIDFSQITDWELFVTLVKGFPMEVTKILFSNLDFSSFELYNDENNNLIIKNKDGIVITEPIYKILVQYMRKINNIPKPKFTKVKDNVKQKALAVRYAKMKLEKETKKRESKEEQSFFLPFISYLDFYFSLEEIKNMNSYRFWEIIKRNQADKNAEHLYHGLYSGCLNLKDNPSISKEMNYLRDL